MRRWVRKLRGVFGLGLVGAGAGAVLGALYAMARSLVGSGAILPENVVLGTMIWGTFGGFTAAGFGVALGILGERIRLESLPLWQAGVVGAAIGALFPPAILTVVGGLAGSPTMAAMLTLSGLCAGLGGFLSFGLVAAAKHELLAPGEAKPSPPEAVGP